VRRPFEQVKGQLAGWVPFGAPPQACCPP
ncbi:MAG: hypothetical protein QOH50_5241, partial [Kribbellaceae bacterium]|nr:hypothetical protein [Kribbellaceae bacterium]